MKNIAIVAFLCLIATACTKKIHAEDIGFSTMIRSIMKGNLLPERYGHQITLQVVLSQKKAS